MPVGEGASSSGPQMFVATSSTETVPTSPLPVVAKARPGSGKISSGIKKVKETDIMTKCDVCNGPGSNQNLVRWEVLTVHYLCDNFGSIE
jgi:hypothetical protein